MSGIVFFRTKVLKELQEFYVSILGMEVWLEQEDCTILRYGNLLIGFCQRDTCENEGMITLEQDLKLLYMEQKISLESALQFANNKTLFKQIIGSSE